jgi:kynurenine formamidase
MADVIDLTMGLDAGTPTHPDDPEPEFENVATIEENGYALTRASMGSHAGTHLDAPSHMISDGKSIDDYPPSRFSGDATVIDVRDQDPIEPALPSMAPDSIVFFWTGHGDDPGEKYFETTPTIAESTAEELVSGDVSIVGIDSHSPDTHPYPIHDILLGNDVLIAENLTNLGAIAGEDCRCTIVPLKFTDCDGAPCRAIAEVPE